MADPAKVAALEEHGTKLAIAVRSKEILAQACGRVIDEACKSLPIDEDATIDREAVTQAVRQLANRVARIQFVAVPVKRTLKILHRRRG